MSWIGGAIAAGGSLLGGILGGESASNAASAAAASNTEAARLAAEAAKFRPVGITTRFGTSNFQLSPEGYLTSAGYELSPELKAIQDYVMGQTRTSLGDVTTLQNLGRSYLAQSPEQVASNWLTQQQGLLQPGREKALAGVRQGLFNTGRGGLSVAQGGDLAASNPELQAYYNAMAQQDAALAAQAQKEGQNQLVFGQGLLSSAYAPLSAGLGLASTLEQLGQTPLDLGAQLGGRAASAGATAGSLLAQGAARAAPYQYASGSFNPFAAALTGASQNPMFGPGIQRMFNNAPSWTTGASVIPQSTFNGLGGDYSLLGGPDMAALVGL